MKISIVLAIILSFIVAMNAQTISSVLTANPGTYSYLNGNLTGSLATNIASATTNTTLFASTNAAFNALPSFNTSGLYSNLNATIYYNAAPGVISFNTATEQNVATSLGGNIRLNNYTAPWNTVRTVNGVPLFNTTTVSNGALYTLNARPAYPGIGQGVAGLLRLPQYSITAGYFNTSVAATQAFVNADPATVLIPDNNAWTTLNNSITNANLSLATVYSNLDGILLAHILNYTYTIFSPALVAGGSLQTKRSGSVIGVGTANLTSTPSAGTTITATFLSADIVLTNGAAHGISAVLLPSGIVTFPTAAPTTAPPSTTTTSTTGSSTSSATSVVASAVLLIASILAMFF